MTRLPVPAVWFEGRRWAPDELAGLAAAWRERLHAEVPPAARLVAAVMDNHVETIALILALWTLPWPVVLLAADPRTWRSAPPLPRTTPIVLPPRWAALAATGAQRGHPVVSLPEPARVEPAEPFVAPALPGMIGFTSGSTGLPKPVYRRPAALLEGARASAVALGLGAGDHAIGVLPLATIHGIVTTLLHGLVVGADLALLPRFDHRTLLALFAAGGHAYLACTPVMAATLARCPLAGPAPPAPRVVRVSGGPLPRDVFEAFRSRFGVPLRPAWGSTEGGIMTADGRAPDEVRPDGVGLPLPGVDVRVGDHPAHPVPPGKAGRVWFRSDAYMEGYGFPPDLEPVERADGWFPSGDQGSLDERGCLVLAGRVDDSFKTPSGHLVSPGEIADALARYPGVRAVEVVPLARPLGAEIGVLVEAADLSPEGLRAHAAACLPPWSQPHALRVVREIPRTPHGKADQRACRELLAAGPS